MSYTKVLKGNNSQATFEYNNITIKAKAFNSGHRSAVVANQRLSITHCEVIAIFLEYKNIENYVPFKRQFSYDFYISISN